MLPVKNEGGIPPHQNRSRFWLVGLVAVAVLGSATFWWTRLTDRGEKDKSDDFSPFASNDQTPGPPLFRDTTADSELDFTYRNGEEANHFSILETLGGGVALIDFDGDGLLDIFVSGGGYFDGPDKKEIKGHPCKLYRNLGNWKFRDVTKEAGLDTHWWYTHGTAVADYDRDGWPDLLVTGFGRIALFHNEPDGKGGRHFVDVTEKVGLSDTSWSTSAGWADIDGDGYPDLYVCHYVDWSFANNPSCKEQGGDRQDVCPPQRFKPVVHALFHNEKGLTFRNVAAEFGFKPDGCGLGVILADFNGDGRPDIYVANDASNNFLFMNRNGKLEEKGLSSGVAVDDLGHYNGSMAADAGDYDGSGRPSIWVTNFQNELHALYQNLGKETFQHQSRATGIGSLSQGFVGFGSAFIDFDNDGWEDLVIANGHVVHYPSSGSTLKQRPVLMRNVEFEGRRFFRDITPRAGPFFQIPNLGRGVAIGDLDNDGWPDIVVSHTNSPVALLRNESRTIADHNWIGIKLAGKGFRDVVGSTIVLQGSTRKLTRFAKGGGSYLSAGDQRILFGLGASEQVKSVTVKWSWGKSQTWENLEPNNYWELHEDEAKAKRVVRPMR